MYLSIDQSTSSTSLFLFDDEFSLIKKFSKNHKQIYPKAGWVEHDANEIYENVLKLAKEIMNFYYMDIKFLSITNQRETFVIFDKYTGLPLHNAIVWQCRRGQEICQKISKLENSESIIKNKTGLKLDTYFPASKLKWLTEENKEIELKLKNGDALFGTIETYLIYRLSNLKSYVTDYTNASRTLIFNNDKLKWDNDLLDLFELNIKILPEVKENSSFFGKTDFNNIFNKEVDIFGVIGDSQGSLFANQCFNKGDTKITLGTGASILTNIGENFITNNDSVTSLSYVHKGKVSYSYECLINYAGALISWLKDNLQIISDPEETDNISYKIDTNGGVYIIPAFVGLSSPYWIPESKGMIYGLTPSSNKNHLIRASLESIAYLIKDYLDFLKNNHHINCNNISVDGGMVKNNFLLQLISDLLKNKIFIPNVIDMSAYGSLLMGLLGTGMFKDLDELKDIKIQSYEYNPTENENTLKEYNEWKKVLKKYYLDHKI